MDISGIFILVEFGRILRLVESGRNLRLVDLSGFSRFYFGFGFRFSIGYRVGIRFGFGFFKYPFYSRVPVLLVLLCAKLKLLLSLGRRSS